MSAAAADNNIMLRMLQELQAQRAEMNAMRGEMQALRDGSAAAKAPRKKPRATPAPAPCVGEAAAAPVAPPVALPVAPAPVAPAACAPAAPVADAAAGAFLRDASQEQMALTELQRDALNKLLARRSGMLFSAPVGFGKTRTGLALLRALLRERTHDTACARAIVLAPSEDVAHVWQQEMSTLGLRAALLTNKRALADVISADPRLLLIATHRWAASEPNARDRAAHLPAAPDGASRMYFLARHAAVKIMLVDEAHAAKNRTSSLHRALALARDDIDSLFLATATPAANLHCDLWNLLKLIDRAFEPAAAAARDAAARLMVSYNEQQLDRDGGAPKSRQEFYSYELPGHTELDAALRNLRKGTADAAHVGSKKMELFRQFAALKLAVLPQQIARVYQQEGARDRKVVLFFFHKPLMTAARDQLRHTRRARRHLQLRHAQGRAAPATARAPRAASGAP